METYHGHVRTPSDAIILFEACRLGLLPRVQRRLSEKERQSIKSGSVFVWDEREAGMRRWTDGKSWSASRVSGSFLTYREMEGKRGGAAFSAPVAAARSRAGKTPDSTRGSDSDVDMVDDGPDGYRYKPDGLMKQSFSITTSTGQHLHLISYYSRTHPAASSLMQPSNDPNLRHIRPPKGVYPESTVHEPSSSSLPAAGRAPTTAAHFAASPHAQPAYPRSGATHPLSYAPPPYAWPPSPVSTPPHTYATGPYGPPGQLPPSNGGSAAASPLQYAQTLPLAPLVPTSAPYDRPPPSVVEGSLPPPPSLLHKRSGSSDSPVQLPSYTSNGPLHYAGPSGMPSEIPTSAPSSKIDPRLTALSAAPSTLHSVSTSRTSPTSTRSLDGDAKLSPSATNGHPSFAALMNEIPDAVSTNPSTVDGRSDRSRVGSRAGSRSPTEVSTKTAGSASGGRPKDIPNEKIGFGEDVRALRVLDRVFSA